MAASDFEHNRPTPETQDFVAATIVKNGREQIRVAIRTMHGERMADIRIYRANGEGNYVETPKGLVLAPALLGELRRAIASAEDAAIAAMGKRGAA